jgi:hypothetical protein
MPMILLDTCLTDLVAGYHAIRRAERELPRQWRSRLLTAYAGRRKAFAGVQARYQQRRRRVLLGFALPAILFVLGSVLGFIESVVTIEPPGTLTCLGWLLILGGLASGGLLTMIYAGLWLARPRLPAHPLQAAQKSKLFLPLLPTWRERLRSRLPAEMPYEGAKGEYEFIDRLARLGAGWIIYRLRQTFGHDDVDVTVVGPMGVWVFEVKYWSGRIIWRKEWWRERRGVLEKAEGEPPDQQWRRMAQEVAETLKRHAGRVLAQAPDASKIRGGLVFTHPGAIYDIQRGGPFNWGTLDFWVKELQAARPIAHLDEVEALELIETLLGRHRQVSGDAATRSMKAFANQLVREAEARLAAWARGVM